MYPAGKHLHKTEHMMQDRARKPKRRSGKERSSGRPASSVPNTRGSSNFSEMPETAIVIITEITREGELLGVPEEWKGRKKPPVITLSESRNAPAAALNDRVLAHISKSGARHYRAHILRILPKEASNSVVGIFVPVAGGGGRIEPASRKSKVSYGVAAEDSAGALGGELVKAVLLPGLYARGLPQARIHQRLGDAHAPRAASLIAAHLHALPDRFSAEALLEADAAAPPEPSAGREDLRGVPLVTIDGEDARDFDDAVFAEPDTTASTPDGFHLIVAIADVAHYVKEGSVLDACAFERGNSVYFADRVIPMLPERLSNGLCSLKPNEDRYALAVHLWIDEGGNTLRYRFTRALMRSRARLTYTQVEDSHRAIDDAEVQSLAGNLFAAYHSLKKQSDKRGTLALNLPEYKVMFDAQGNVEAIAPRPQLQSHRLIEAFMVAANVAAADFLLKNRALGIYRVHEPPSEDKIEELRRMLGFSGFAFPKGAITPAHLNRVLRKAEGMPNAAIIHTMVLRSQMQAYYDNRNLGHFGLALSHYCHFTSPIRRYADLVVHRSLTALLENERPTAPARNLKETAAHISDTERTAMMAERDAMDRYKIAYIARQREKVFSGAVTSVNAYGVFVSLAGNGITGFIPVHLLGDDFFLYRAHVPSFTGRQSKQTYGVGDKLSVRVVEADAVKGSLIFRPDGFKAKLSKSNPGGKRSVRHHEV